MNTEDAFTPEQMTAVVGALHNASMEKWIGAGMICIIGAVVIKIVIQALNRLVAKLPLDKAMLGFLTAAARIVMVIVLATMVAGQLNVPITSLVALLSLFALAVSLSVQDVLANVVSGMVILIAKPFVAGNFISTQNAEGTVERIGLMYTHLVTADNKAVMIPNKEILAERIINYTAKDYRRVDVKLCIGSEMTRTRCLTRWRRPASARRKGARRSSRRLWASTPIRRAALNTSRASMRRRRRIGTSIIGSCC